MKNMYDLKLNETMDMTYNNYMEIIRVPGGWLYKYHVYDHSDTMTFVPYDEEFLGENENGDIKIPPFKE